MKLRILFSVLALAAAATVSADIITRPDGTRINAKVEAINETTVTYRKASNPNGPVYTLPITSIANIVYDNGEVDKFNEVVAEPKRETAAPSAPAGQLSDVELLKLYYTREKAYESLIKSSKNKRIIGWTVGGVLVAGGAVMVGLVYSDIISVSDEELYDGMLYGGIGAAAAGVGVCLGFNLKANSQMRKLREIETLTASVIDTEFAKVGNARLIAGINVLSNRAAHDRGLGVGLTLKF